MSKKKTNEQFQAEFQAYGNKNIRLLGYYTTQKTQIPVECIICGNKWNAWPMALLRGSGCSKCSNNHKLTDEEFAKRLDAANPNIIILGKYISTHRHIDVQCKKCGHKWSASPANLLRKYGCPICNGGTKQSKEEFLERMQETHPDIHVLGEYVNALTPVLVKCLRCGNTWKAAPNTMLNGNKSGCPACAHNQSSFLEQLILAMCISCYGTERVLSRNREIIGSELDIVVLNSDKKPIFAIEPGSWTLHKDKYTQDENKLIECNKRNIQLLIIYDQDVKKEVNETDTIWSYKKTFSVSNRTQLAELLMRIANHFGFPVDIELDKLIEIAHNNSRRISTEEFRKRLYAVNPDIISLGEYNGAMRKTKVKCKNCGYCWSPTPQMLLLLKTGCPSSFNTWCYNTISIEHNQH